tara:strand:- start:171 stop:512 length:342 start_codon:yes stop_codon:yes gene_type:complete
MSTFERAWRIVKAHDRDALLPEERKLPGGDAFVGPHVTARTDHGGSKDEPWFEYDVDEDEDTGYDEHLDRNIAHQQDEERKRILAEGVPHHQSEKEGGLGDSGEYQNDRKRDS